MVQKIDFQSEAVRRIENVGSYPGVENASLTADSTLYDYFRYRTTDHFVERKISVDEQRSVLSELGLKGVNGAIIAFGSFTNEGDLEAVPWLAPANKSGHFLYHLDVIGDLLVDMPEGVLTDEYPNMTRSFIADMGERRPRIVMQEFDILPLEHKKAVSRLARSQTALKFSLLERSKGQTRVTDFKPQ